MRRIRLLIPAFFLLLLGSCKKDTASTPSGPDIASVINVATPGTGVIFTNGSTLKIEGDVTDNNGLSTVRVEVKNKTTNAILFQQSSTAGNATFYRFLWNWVVTGITTLTPATVKITAKDLQSNEVSKEVDIKLDN